MLSFFKMIAVEQTSYSSWASIYSTQVNQPVSKQAIFKRMNSSWIQLLKLLIEKHLQTLLKINASSQTHHPFKNIYIQDSTCLKLPDVLNTLYPGNVSRGLLKAVLKINVVLNVTKSMCHSFSISSFKTNEQSLAGDVFRYAKKGDLILRDLGYYALKVFHTMKQKGIHFISRQKYRVALFDAKTNKEISLISLLKKTNYIIDKEILCGKKEKLPVRLVAIKLDNKKANERRRKARHDRDRRVNHSSEYYYMLGYIIFITSVDQQTCTVKQIAKLYGIRWQIETLFKSWKSGIKIDSLLPKIQYKSERIQGVIYMFMLYIIWFEQKIKVPLMLIAKAGSNKNISVIKLMKLIKTNLHIYLMEGSCFKINKILHLCFYEKRKRVNAIECLDNLLDGFG